MQQALHRRGTEAVVVEEEVATLKTKTVRLLLYSPSTSSISVGLSKKKLSDLHLFSNVVLSKKINLQCKTLRLFLKTTKKPQAIIF